MVHPLPPETINPPAVIVSRPTSVLYGVAGLGVDEVEFPVVCAGSIESEQAVDQLKNTCRTAVLADQTLGGVVSAAYPSGERNWRNYTGGGGIQLLLVELVLTIHM
jgi:hypothetical protein